MTLEDLSVITQTVGVIGLLLVAIVGAFRRWYVFGWYAVKLETDVEFWRTMALRGISAAETTASLAASVVTKAAADSINGGRKP